MSKPETDLNNLHAIPRSELLAEGQKQARIHGVSPEAAPVYAEGWAAAVQAAQGILLTDDEHRAVELAGELWNLLNRIVRPGRSRAGDLGEICTHIHNLQHAVLAQAAARAYPNRYRLLGGLIDAPSATPSLCVHCAAMPGERHRQPCPWWKANT